MISQLLMLKKIICIFNEYVTVNNYMLYDYKYPIPLQIMNILHSKQKLPEI